MKLTRTGKIIFAVTIVVLSTALGYLIWRVNSEGNLGPDDSDAGNSYNGWCHFCCDSSELADGFCSSSEGADGCTETVTCGDGVSIHVPDDNPAEYCPRCYHAAPGDDDPVGGVECNIGSQCNNKCYWPEVAYCTGAGECICKGDEGNNCDDDSAQCTPSCPAGYERCDSNCGADSVEAECSARCAGCDNLYYQKITCKKIPVVVNVCDGGSWISKPSGNIAYEAGVSFSAKANDKDGIDPNSIVVKKNGTALPKCSGSNTNCISLSEAASETTISGVLSTADGSVKLDPGSYSISMDWKDKKGATSTTCALSTTFTILEEETNPDWDISKAVVEQCIDENTTNPKSELTYTITVTNTGDGAGRITKIEDILDTKVLDGFVQTSTISDAGVYSSGKILWDFSTSPVTVNPGSTKVFTYTMEIDKEHFDTYSNEVTLYPEESDSITATANITADCEISDEPEIPETPEVPQTGILDSSIGRLITGIVLVIVGIAVYRVPSMSLHVHVKNGKMYIRDKNINKIRERFEKRVENK